MAQSSPHTFHIPVMGTGFTIDTPLFVAKYGINSVISLVDDVLIEQMRKYWCEQSGEPYVAIGSQDPDARALRITAYLNLLQKLIERQIAEVRAAPFEPGSEITKYFELLPAGELQRLYQKMLREVDSVKKLQLEQELRTYVVPGSIDVNIMTKLDRQNFRHGEPLPYDYNDAAAALRGYAQSNLASTIIFSAGFNPNLYGYLTKFQDFFPDANFELKKKICLKVSDYRSAAVQGKYLAKHGLWVSEYRIESPLNCGGHAFVNDGQLLGPILEEFKMRRTELIESLHSFYQQALAGIKKICAKFPQRVKITAQGGVGTHEEQEFLLKRYELDSIGWGTPFLLVPEVVNVDPGTLNKLITATDDEVYLSNSSPLGVPFWNLTTSSSEEARRARIASNQPGSYCVKGYLRFKQEGFVDPICRAAREYQAKKLQELAQSNLPEARVAELREDVLAKACICHELGNSALFCKKLIAEAVSAICPGPNIVNFKKVMALKELIGHIYGRCWVFLDQERPHMFIREFQLQLAYVIKEAKALSRGLPARSRQKLLEVKQNFEHGLGYYQEVAKTLVQEQRENFLAGLQELEKELAQLALEA